MTWYVALGAVILAALVVALDRRRLSRTMDRLDAMLDGAIAGELAPGRFDESRVSAVEAKLARCLAGSSASARRLAADQERVRALVADISHQTKTPIANLLLYAGLLEERPLAPEDRACVEQMAGQAEKLRFLIEALVKAGRLETGVIAVQPRRAPVRPLVKGALADAAQKAAGKGIALTGTCPEIEARFDPKWTREALDNLLDNAVKYTPAGGGVTVSVTPYELFCRIDVADTGMGLAEEEQGKIFQRFYRSPRVRDEQGVGLGLYLTREIAAAQGGYVKVSSRAGEGSTFSLFLPRTGM